MKTARLPANIRYEVSEHMKFLLWIPDFFNFQHMKIAYCR